MFRSCPYQAENQKKLFLIDVAGLYQQQFFSSQGVFVFVLSKLYEINDVNDYPRVFNSKFSVVSRYFSGVYILQMTSILSPDGRTLRRKFCLLKAIQPPPPN